jgi:hypothetical protein
MKYEITWGGLRDERVRAAAKARRIADAKAVAEGSSAW